MRKLTKTTCDLCGKTFGEYDKLNDFCITEVPGYGSRYDGEKIHINLCCKCFDSIVDKAFAGSMERDARRLKAQHEEKRYFDYHEITPDDLDYHGDEGEEQ